MHPSEINYNDIYYKVDEETLKIQKAIDYDYELSIVSEINDVLPLIIKILRKNLPDYKYEFSYFILEIMTEVKSPLDKTDEHNLYS